MTILSLSFFGFLLFIYFLTLNTSIEPNLFTYRARTDTQPRAKFEKLGTDLEIRWSDGGKMKVWKWFHSHCADGSAVFLLYIILIFVAIITISWFRTTTTYLRIYPRIYVRSSHTPTFIVPAFRHESRYTLKGH
ncbi:hypothetical protein IW262DRAFT_1395824 [Armillaria fumosa]|nr:hypothetical protein IW262DRAFT_1395824 [Armillaria fumosa]